MRKNISLTVALIVKNESATVRRALASVREIADKWLIIDTGSTDNTIEVIKEATEGWEGNLYEEPWVDFSYNRNSLAKKVDTDWVLYIDADQTIKNSEIIRKEIETTDKDVLRIVSDEEPRYWNPRLVKAGLGIWKGRTHEALNFPEGTKIGFSDAVVVHHADGGSRSDKLERDETLLNLDLADAVLSEDLVAQARTNYYLGITFLGMQEFSSAIEHFEKAYDLSSWDEEKYMSLFMVGICHKKLGNITEASKILIKAARLRKGRYEAAFEGVRVLNSLGQHIKAAIVGEKMLSAAPIKNDVLDVYSFSRYLLALEASGSALVCNDVDAAARMISIIDKRFLPDDLVALFNSRLSAIRDFKNYRY